MRGYKCIVGGIILFCLVTSNANAIKVKEKLDLTIKKGVLFMQTEVKGNKEGYVNSSRVIDGIRVYEGKTFRQSMVASVRGKFGDFFVEGVFDDTKVPSKRKLIGGYEKENFSLRAGDIRTGFANLSYFMETRENFGIRGFYKSVRYKAGFVVSERTTKSGYDAFKGDYTNGPFFLSHYPVVKFSEKVYIDERLLVNSIDYEIDYEHGSIRFKNIVEDFRDIEVYYEYSSYFDVADASNSGFVSEVKISKNFKVGAGYGLERKFNLNDMFIKKHEVFNYNYYAKVGRYIRLKGELGLSSLKGEKSGLLKSRALFNEVNFVKKPVRLTLKFLREEPDFYVLGAKHEKNDRQYLDMKLNFSKTTSSSLDIWTRVEHTNVLKSDEKPVNYIQNFEVSGYKIFKKLLNPKLNFELRMNRTFDNLEIKNTDTKAQHLKSGIKLRFKKLLTDSYFKVERNADFVNEKQTEALTTYLSLKYRVHKNFVLKGFGQFKNEIDVLNDKDYLKENLAGFDLETNYFNHFIISLQHTTSIRKLYENFKEESSMLNIQSRNIKNFNSSLKLIQKRKKQNYTDYSVVSGNYSGSIKMTYRIMRNFYSNFNYEIRFDDLVELDNKREKVGFEVGFEKKRFLVKTGIRYENFEDNDDEALSYKGKTFYLSSMLIF